MRERIIAIVAAVIFFGIGIFVGTKIAKTQLPKGAANDAQNTYQSGWDAAMKSLQASGAVPALPDSVQIKQISGTVKAVSGSTITLAVSSLGLTNTPELATRTITIDGNTKIEQLVQRDPAAIQKDMDAFNAQMAALKNQQSASTPQNIPTPPQIQDKQDVKAADIKVGQSITITAANDIKNAQQITATEIDIQTMAAGQTANGASPVQAPNAPQVVPNATPSKTVAVPPAMPNVKIPNPANPTKQ